MEQLNNGTMNTILSIIILSYNTADITTACIKSIFANYKKEIDDKTLEVIIVDNASTDNSLSAILNLQFTIFNGRKRFKIIQNKKNVGFAKGCNLGAKNAQGKYLLFLNSDTQASDKGFLQMIEFLEKNKNIGVLGGKLLNPDGTSQASGGNFYNLWNLFIMLLGGERLGLVRKEAIKKESVDWVSGACMMIRKELFEKLNGFDEYFFMYIEDMELCFRVKKLGFEIYFYPDIRLFHKMLGSSNRKFAIMNIYKGILYFYRKQMPFWQYQAAKLMLACKAGVLASLGNKTYEKSFSYCRE